MSRTKSVLATLGAGVLVLALVVAPPEAPAERSTPRTVQPTAMTFSPTAVIAAWHRIVDADPRAAAARAVQVPTQHPPGTGPVQRLDAAPTAAAAALALPTPGNVIATLLGPLLRNPFIAPILGPIILFGPIIALVVLACPPCALVNFVGGIIRSFLIELAPVGIAAAAVTAELPVEEEQPRTPSEATEPEAPEFSSAAEPELGRRAIPETSSSIEEPSPTEPDSPAGEANVLDEEGPEVPEPMEEAPLDPPADDEEPAEEDVATEDTEEPTTDPDEDASDNTGPTDNASSGDESPGNETESD